MARLTDLRTKLGGYGDVAESIGQLTAFITMVTAGVTTAGAAVTLPLILQESAKTAGSLSKLLKVLLTDEGENQANKIDPFERADDIFYVFAQRSYLRAFDKLNDKLKNQVKKNNKINMDQYKELAKLVQDSVVTPDRAMATFTFGWNPDTGLLPLFESYSKWLSALLRSFGVGEKDVIKVVKEIELEARKYLHKELVSKGADRQWMVNYQLLENTSEIKELLQGYFAKNSDIEEAQWQRYLSEVALKPTLPIWGEEENGLGIEKLFVLPDYGYAKVFIGGHLVQGNPEKSTNLKAFLMGLLSRRRPSTELVFVMGGPGTGKTSLMEVFSSEVAKTGEVQIILVPAKKLDPNKAIFPEVQKFLADAGYGPLADLLATTEDCIIAIDGFDELAHATLSTLEKFFRDAQELVRERSSTRLRILLSGRPTLFSKNDVPIPTGSHVVTIQPFDAGRVSAWSTNWRTSTGGTFDGINYLKSKNHDLRELATQPMLLYLLARMHESGEAIPTNIIDEGGVRFKVYQQILNWVCQRQEDKGIPTSLSIKLRRFLQIAGLATHQSGQRTLHWSQFGRTLENAGLADDSNALDAKMYSTILSFAFSNIRDQAWEFTHKSFGEALAAEAIGRVLEDICEQGRDGEPWRLPLPIATKTWVETFGPYFLTKDIMDLCQGWLHTKGEIFCLQLIPRLIEIFTNMFGPSPSSAVAQIVKDFERSTPLVIGNALRSWLNVTNEAMKIIVMIDGIDRLKIYKDTILFEMYRQAVYQANIVSPISTGEGEQLLYFVSRCVKGAKTELSKTYYNELVKLLYGFGLKTSAIEHIMPARYEWIDIENKLMLNSNKFVSHMPIANSEFFQHFFPFGRDLNDYSTPLERAFSSVENLLQHVFERAAIDDLYRAAGLTSKVELTRQDYEKLQRHLKAFISELPTDAMYWVESLSNT